MRLDHLLSREKTEVETQRFHLRSIHRKVLMRKVQTKSLALTEKFFLKMYRFQGSKDSWYRRVSESEPEGAKDLKKSAPEA